MARQRIKAKPSGYLEGGQYKDEDNNDPLVPTKEANMGNHQTSLHTQNMVRVCVSLIPEDLLRAEFSWDKLSGECVDLGPTSPKA